MLKQRSNNNVSNHIDHTQGTSSENYQLDNPNSAKATALSCPSDEDLRVPCYCEENVWRLAYRRLFGPSSVSSSPSLANENENIDKENEQYYVVFVSNEEKCCPMLHQKASKHSDEVCFWDYHVILIRSFNISSDNNAAEVAQVLDMDSRLPYSCTIDEYLDETFKINFVDRKASKKYSPQFRVVRAELFLQNFHSDRMHMFKNGKWSSPPPEYDCILTDTRNMNISKTGSMSNLNDYINMSGASGKESSPMGEVLDLTELRAKFGG